jgi:hypothetical protein
MLKMEMAEKNNVLTFGIIILCLFLFALFPTEGIFQKIIVYLTFFIVVPILFIRIILKSELSKFGVQKGNLKKGILLGAGMLAVSLAIFYALFHYTSFSEKYYLSPFVQQKFLFFVLYEMLLVGFYVLIYEFFFRGLVMFGLKGVFNQSSIIAQFALMALFFWVIGSFNWSVAHYLIAAPLAGFVAYQSRSIWYSLAATWLFIIISDAFLIAVVK